MEFYGKNMFHGKHSLKFFGTNLFHVKRKTQEFKAKFAEYA